MNIQQACDAFRILLEEQQARIANANGEKKDFSKMNTITIGIIEGDGIGPLIMAQAEKTAEIRKREIERNAEAQARALREETSPRAEELSGEILRRMENGNF